MLALPFAGAFYVLSFMEACTLPAQQAVGQQGQAPACHAMVVPVAQ
jgi:hypothetical protein